MCEEIWTTDYEGKCGNCHKSLREDDKYCRYCGTKRGDGAFEPYRNIMQCIYGPMPVYRWHECPSCSHSWETHLMIDEQDYCPKCGSRANLVQPGSSVSRMDFEPTLSVIFCRTNQRINDLSSPITIGRGKLNSVPIADQCVSRRHALITRDDGHWVLEDLSSINGTFLNGDRILPGKKHILSNRDRITLGVSEELIVSFC